MPALDIFHEALRKALVKDGWTITNNPLFLRVDDEPFYIDFGAEKLIIAEKVDHKIAVELKSFVGSSYTSDFHLAVGQFVNYRVILRRVQPERILYLAVPQDIFAEYFGRRFPQDVIADEKLKLIVFDVSKEEIVLWIE